MRHMKRLVQVEIGDQAFLSEGADPIGAVREIRPSALVIYVEGGGDFIVSSPAVRSVHDGKVVLDAAELDGAFLAAARSAHAREID